MRPLPIVAITIATTMQLGGKVAQFGSGLITQVSGRIVKQVAKRIGALVEAILRSWQAHRAAPDESFVAFARRHEITALQAMVEQIGDAA